MNTAAPSRKKLLSLVLTLVFMLTCLPAALAVDLNVDAGFYFKQSRGGTCTLASAAMMLRRRAYFDGLTDWSTVTENSVRSTALHIRRCRWATAHCPPANRKKCRP